MINLDDDEIISAIESLLGRNCKPSMRKYVQYEFKPDRFEGRLLCLVDCRLFIVLFKNNKPSKVESFIHLLDIKRIESPTSTQILIQTNDNRDFKFQVSESASSEDSSSGRLSISNQSTESVPAIHGVIDEIIFQIVIGITNVFPNVPIRDLIETVNVLPEKRWHTLQTELTENKKYKKMASPDICGNYAQSYLIFCDLFGSNIYQEVVWDINFIYGQNGLKEFSLNDFDYALKDAIPLIAALRHNLWFESIQSDGIKLTCEMQEEIQRLFTMPSNKIRSMSLVHSNLKYDFLQKLYNSFQTGKSRKTNGASLKSLNLSRNSIEDRGLNYLANLFKDFSYLSNLSALSLSKCSLASKGVNSLFSAMSVQHSLSSLDLSFNNLKDEPTELLKYLAESNQLSELNLSNTDIDIDKLFTHLSKGGCEKNLKKLVLAGNTSFGKLGNLEHVKAFFGKVKSLAHLDVSHCKLNGNITLNLLNSIQLNSSLPKSLHINLSSNDMGSYVRTLQNEFSFKSSITSVDLSDNGLDADTDLIINDMRNSNIKSLVLSRNFQNSKTKHVSKVVQSLIKWITCKNSQLLSLWLVDCRLKSNLNDFVNELGTCAQLRFLDISGNDVGDFGINLLSKSLQVNRSLQTLLFDRSNVTPVAYTHITEALKRNITLRSIQMPINDICASYQKSPERVIDAVKQMTELFSHRNLSLSAQHKFDLDQLFKTKMKSINDGTGAGAGVNASPSSANSPPPPPQQNSSFSSSSSSSPTSNVNKSLNAEALDDEPPPPSVKEILCVLNEAATSYLNENSVEKQFAQLNEQYLDKLESMTTDIDRELNACLRKKYRKYSTASSPPLSNPQQQPSKSLCSIENGKLTGALKANLREYMNSMLIQMHNDICEITYNMSAAMAETLMNEVNTFNQLNSKPPSSKPAAAVTPAPSPVDQAKKDQDSTLTPDVQHQQSAAVKKPVGGIKMFPGLPLASMLPQSSSSSAKHTSSADGHQSDVYHRIELMNNPKSKRPISTQMQQDAAEGAANNNNNQSSLVLSSSPTHLSSSSTEQPKPSSRESKSSSSSSFENMKNGSDEEDESSAEKAVVDNSSSEKTQVTVLASARTKSMAPVAPLASNSSVNFPISSSSSSSLTNEDKSSSDSRSRSKSPFEILSDAALLTSARSQKPQEPEPTTTVEPAVPTPAPRKAKSLVKSIFASFGSSSHSNNSEITSPKASRKAVPSKEAATVVAAPPVQTQAQNEAAPPEDETRTLQHLNKNRAKRANVKRPTVKHPVSTISEAIAEDDYMNDSTSTAPVHLNGNGESLMNGIHQAAASSMITSANGVEVDPPPSISITTTIDSPVATDASKLTKSNSPTSPAVKPVEQPKISLNELGNVKLRRTIKVKNTEDTAAPPSSSATSTPSAEKSSTLTSLATTPLAPSLAATVGGTASALSSLNSAITPVSTTTATVSNDAKSNAQSSGKLGNRFSMFEQPSLFSNLKSRSKDTEPVAEEQTQQQQQSTGEVNNKNSISVEANKLPSKTPPPIPPVKPPRPAFNPALTPVAGSSSAQTTPIFDKVKLRSVPGTTSTNAATTPSANPPSTDVNKSNAQKQQDLNDKRASVREIVQMLSVSEESKA